MLEFYQAYTDYQGLMDLYRGVVETGGDRCDRFGRNGHIRGWNSTSAACGELSIREALGEAGGEARSRV